MLTDFSDLKSGVIKIGVPTHIGTCFLSQYIENFNFWNDIGVMFRTVFGGES